MLGVVGLSLKMVKFEPTCRNMVANMLHPTMLRYAVLPCCDSLAGALEITIKIPAAIAAVHLSFLHFPSPKNTKKNSSKHKSTKYNAHHINTEIKRY